MTGIDGEGPYVFTRSEGMVHIRLRADPVRCLACVRADAFEIVWTEALREAMAAARRVAGSPMTEPAQGMR